MANGKGIKAGWIWGWLGGFLWVAVLAVIFLFQGKTAEGVAGLVLTALGVIFVFLFAPWKNPHRAFGILMIPLYLVFFASVAWLIRSFGGLERSGLRWWNLIVLITVFLPALTAGGKKWETIGK